MVTKMDHMLIKMDQMLTYWTTTGAQPPPPPPPSTSIKETTSPSLTCREIEVEPVTPSPHTEALTRPQVHQSDIESGRILQDPIISYRVNVKCGVYRHKCSVLTAFTARFLPINDTVLIDLGKNGLFN